MRARAQGEVERYKRENSRLSARIAQFEQEQHEIRKSTATAEHLEARIDELHEENQREKTRLERLEGDNVRAREMVSNIAIVVNTISVACEKTFSCANAITAPVCFNVFLVVGTIGGACSFLPSYLSFSWSRARARSAPSDSFTLPEGDRIRLDRRF